MFDTDPTINRVIRNIMHCRYIKQFDAAIIYAERAKLADHEKVKGYIDLRKQIGFNDSVPF